jgi:hypothetical protein
MATRECPNCHCVDDVNTNMLKERYSDEYRICIKNPDKLLGEYRRNCHYEEEYRYKKMSCKFARYVNNDYLSWIQCTIPFEEVWFERTVYVCPICGEESFLFMKRI